MRRRGLDRRVHALVGAAIGDLDGPTAIVDEHGRIGVIDGSWWIEWGVGADDRWRVAHEEVAVRQSRVADAPVYETWMRVPGGDVIQRVASANDGLGRTLVVEFENASPAAVAVAVAGRVADEAAVAVDVDAVGLDGMEWIRAPRPAGAAVAVDGDPWPEVVAGPGATRAEVVGRQPCGVLVLPLPHRQIARFLVLLEGEFPSRDPSTDAIAVGWRAVTGEAMTIDLPDAALGEAWNRILPDLVVQAGSSDPRAAAEAAPWLDVAGLHAEADRARATVVAAAVSGRLDPGDAVAALRALASRDLLAGSSSGLDDLAGPLAAAAAGALDPTTLHQTARALEATAPAAAADARRAADRAEGAFSWVSPPAVAAARVLGTVVAPGAGCLELLPGFAEGWLGRPVDVRGCGTAEGRVSFSVRWHGDRPALLWERHGGGDAIELRCGSLDPTWSTSQRTGEALLAAPGVET